MIIETIVTTLDADGVVNIAPMGVEWTGGDDAPVLKPFLETVTYRNVAKLLEDPTGSNPIDHGDFYVSFEILIAK